MWLKTPIWRACQEICLRGKAEGKAQAVGRPDKKPARPLKLAGRVGFELDAGDRFELS